MANPATTKKQQAGTRYEIAMDVTSLTTPIMGGTTAPPMMLIIKSDPPIDWSSGFTLEIAIPKIVGNCMLMKKEMMQRATTLAIPPTVAAVTQLAQAVLAKMKSRWFSLMYERSADAVKRPNTKSAKPTTMRSAAL